MQVATAAQDPKETKPAKKFHHGLGGSSQCAPPVGEILTVGGFWVKEVLPVPVNDPHIYSYMGIWVA